MHHIKLNLSAQNQTEFEKKKRNIRWKKRDDYLHDVAIKATYCLYFSSVFVLLHLLYDVQEEVKINFLITIGNKREYNINEWLEKIAGDQ